MTRIRYTMPARSQGEPYAQRAAARLEREAVHRRLCQRLDGFYCELQAMYTPPPTARAEIVPVGLQGAQALDDVDNVEGGAV